jgi:hypothetical protein
LPKPTPCVRNGSRRWATTFRYTAIETQRCGHSRCTSRHGLQRSTRRQYGAGHASILADAPSSSSSQQRQRRRSPVVPKAPPPPAHAENRLPPTRSNGERAGLPTPGPFSFALAPLAGEGDRAGQPVRVTRRTGRQNRRPGRLLEAHRDARNGKRRVHSDPVRRLLNRDADVEKISPRSYPGTGCSTSCCSPAPNPMRSRFCPRCTGRARRPRLPTQRRAEADVPHRSPRVEKAPAKESEVPTVGRFGGAPSRKPLTGSMGSTTL